MDIGTLILVLLVITSTIILVSRDWRWSTVALALQYLVVLFLVSVVWPFGLAAIKLVVGWMAGAVLGTAQLGQKTIEEGGAWPANRLFRLLSAGMAVIIIFSIAPTTHKILPTVPMELFEGGLILIIFGILQLGMTGNPFRVIVGLLTVFSGFEVIYSALESSVLVAGLLAASNLGLATVGAYWLSLDSQEAKT